VLVAAAGLVLLVAAALAIVVWPHLPRRGRMALVVLVLAVGLLRLYVGAHLPLDVSGGVGLGLAVGGAIAAALGWQEARGAAMVDR
jgi:undecaprenyl-diphosphatase